MSTTPTWTDAIRSAAIEDSRLAEVRRLAVKAQARRARAEYDTGSITDDEAAMLWALCEYLSARVVIEVGTFIGMSTHALAASPSVEAVYTCDFSNDCVRETDVIHPYPKYTSTQMLRDLVARSVRADLCFFDGVVLEADLALLAIVTHPGTVYAFHDYNYGPKIRRTYGSTWMETVPRKGIGNVLALQPHLPRHLLIQPPAGTTLALLVPEGRL